MPKLQPILVAGAAGDIGAMVVRQLRARRVPVRALVHRYDARAEVLRAMDGVDVVVADLTSGPDVVTALDGCRRFYFGMSVSAYYLEASAMVAAAALANGSVELLVNMSQMTVSQMDLTSVSESRQQRQHWLAEHVLNWSGLPVAHIRPTVFMENPLFAVLAVASIQRDGTIRLPFGSARTSPVAGRDVAEVVTRVLTDPSCQAGRVYELTGPASRDMTAIAAEISAALGRAALDHPVRYVDVPYEDWLEHDLRPLGLPPHVFDHVATIARLHKQNRYDRATPDVAEILGRPPASFADFITDAVSRR